MTETTPKEVGGKILKTIDKAAFINQTARCPVCGEPVHALTNGAYACESGGKGMDSPHIFYSRNQLNGDLRWWHGRMPWPLLMFVVLLVILYAATKNTIRNLGDGE